MKTFEDYRKEFQDLITLSEWDAEGAHVMADELLCEFAMQLFVNGTSFITEVQGVELIDLYNNVEKWYA